MNFVGIVRTSIMPDVADDNEFYTNLRPDLYLQQMAIKPSGEILRIHSIERMCIDGEIFR